MNTYQKEIERKLHKRMGELEIKREKLNITIDEVEKLRDYISEKLENENITNIEKVYIGKQLAVSEIYYNVEKIVKRGIKNIKSEYNFRQF